MKSNLLYVGVIHETASVEERSYFALSASEKNDLKEILKSRFLLKGLIIISTCNRTEIYFESPSTSALEMREALIEYTKQLHRVEVSRKVFLLLNHTTETVNHLLRVANGLRSAVVGDKQIIHQVKVAYLDALRQKNQGSLLERAFQAVFRSHKRIHRESLYQQGSTSTAYSSLKLIEDFFGKEDIKNRSLLIVGAGEIAEDLLKYLPKFKFSKKSISNRTASKARKLAKNYDIKTYDWQHVLSNDFSSFDVVIAAVSNQKHLINTTEKDGKRRLWIDLAMPSNIDESIGDQFNSIYNIDDVTSLVSSISEAQIEAIPVVEKIINEELNVFLEWLKKEDLRGLLRSHKQHAKSVLLKLATKELSSDLSQSALDSYVEPLANRMVRKAFKELNHFTKIQQLKTQENIDLQSELHMANF